MNLLDSYEQSIPFAGVSPTRAFLNPRGDIGAVGSDQFDCASFVASLLRASLFTRSQLSGAHLDRLQRL